jgi:hypothetical protein
LDSFNVHQYARNHNYSNPSGLSCEELNNRRLEACRTSAQTMLTFAYPIPAGVSITKQPDGCSFQAGNPVSTGCSGNAGYIINIRRQSFMRDDKGKDLFGAIRGNLTIRDTFDAAHLQNVNANGCGFSTPPATISGNTITWTADGDTINNGGVIRLCVHGTTKLPAGQNFSTFANNVNVTGRSSLGNAIWTKTSDGRVGIGINETATNTIYNIETPYLTTNAGDVHAGGGIGFGIACGGSGKVVGQTGGSKGDYVVSAGGAVLGFGSNAVAASSAVSSSLSATGYSRVCRPDLITKAQLYSGPGAIISMDAATWKSSGEDAILGGATCPGPTADPNG